MVPLQSVAVIPAPQDNCAVALRMLAAGTVVAAGDLTWPLRHDVPEGHRFTIRPVPQGDVLTSWGYPFGEALEPLPPGTYLCNRLMLDELPYMEELRCRPERANFRDWYRIVRPSAARWRAGSPPVRDGWTDTFDGYARGPRRGVGTRNCLVILAVSSRVNPLVRALAERLGGQEPSGGLDGVVAVCHTEGGSETPPQNAELLLRTLAGWICHPNAGAVLAVDSGSEPVSNRRLQDYLERSGRLDGFGPEDLRPAFLSTGGAFDRPLSEAAAVVAGWVEVLRRARRRSFPASGLNIALQCGGSDSFSGISANPLAAGVAERVIRQGGSANLAETPELAGAEEYVLANVRDRQVAEQFLLAIERFRGWMAEHGHDPEGNPSAGNRRRGLYNITLKALGAAMKKPAAVRLEEVVDYGEPPRRAGLYFMNSPGNDLESIAGQVASGCNLIVFTTGSGSVTNFPFVPTLKVMSTSTRFRLLSRDMDIDAGRVLEGEDLDHLAEEAYRLALQVASGRRTRGELAGHAQVSVWRDWRQGDPGLGEEAGVSGRGSGASEIKGRESAVKGRESTVSPFVGGGIEPPLTPGGRTACGGVAGQEGSSLAPSRTAGTAARRVPDRLPTPVSRLSAPLRCDLIVPTSLCAGQVAVAAARRLSASPLSPDGRRVVALPHTEGCGCTGGTSQDLFERVLLGHLTHPLVARALLLEHGCEKVHNQRIRRLLEGQGIAPGRFGWASIQTDGGFESVLERIAAWHANAPTVEPAESVPVIGLGATGPLPDAAWTMLAEVAAALADGGWAVVEVEPVSRPLPLTDGRPPVGRPPAAARPSGSGGPARLDFAQPPPGPGHFRMEPVSGHWVETLTGLAAAGCLAVIAWHGDGPRPGHPLVPVLRVGPAGGAGEFDLTLPDGGPPAAQWGIKAVLTAFEGVQSGRQAVCAWRLGDVDFQVPRGPWGISV